VSNYRHAMGLYLWRCDSFGQYFTLVTPVKHHYALASLRAGPVGSIEATFRCTWLAARQFPGKLIPVERRRA
jgi:hypothetical protein